MNRKCPYCGSFDTLPFEEEQEHDFEVSLSLVIVLGLIIIGIYLAVIVTSYLYYPIVVFGGIIIASKFVNKSGSKKNTKRSVGKESDYICLNCNRNFRD